MGQILGIYNWFLGNYIQLGVVVSLGIGFAEAVVKLTPTATDDGAVSRIGAWIDKILKFIPSVKK